MSLWLRTFWEKLRTSWWLVPGLMVTASIALALLMLYLDSMYLKDVQEQLLWVWTGGADGARELLGVVAGSMIGVAGVTFSITIVALTLASNQFGPRILYSFLRDRGNQITLGMFVSTFTYSLMVLRAVRADPGESGDPFVPNMSVTVAIVLALVSIGVLIYFFHHVSQSIRAENIVAEIGHDLGGAIGRLFPRNVGQPPEVKSPEHEEAVREQIERDGTPVCFEGQGYLQAIDQERLMQAAATRDVVFRCMRRPGHYIMPGMELVRVWPPERVDDKLAEHVREAFITGSFRTLTQDVEFAVAQLVEVAVRSLSKGINDPFTAVACIDQLGSGLIKLTSTVLPAPLRYDDEGKLRVVAYPTRFQDLMDAAFNQIRQYGAGAVGVIIHLVEVLSEVARQAKTEEQLASLETHARLAREAGVESFQLQSDREDLERRYADFRGIVEERRVDMRREKAGG